MFIMSAETLIIRRQNAMLNTMRVLSQNNQLIVQFTNTAVADGTLTMPIPPAQDDLPLQEWRHRGDMLALWQRYHVPTPQSLPDMLHHSAQMRVLLLGMRDYAGVAYNARPFLERCPSNSLAGALARYVLHGQLPAQWTPEAQTLLAQAATQLTQQDNFMALMQRIMQLLQLNQQVSTQQMPALVPDESPASADDAAVIPQEQDNTQTTESAATAASLSWVSSTHTSYAADARLSVLAGNADDSFTLQQYKVFSTAYDKVIAGQRLATLAEQQTYWQNLEPYVQRVRREMAKTTIQVRRQLALMSLKRARHKTHHDGVLDTRRLVQHIIAPSCVLPMRQPQQRKQVYAAVSILVDNSGSMRGKPIATAAACAYATAQVLERAGALVEILGFTTADWRGGQSRKAWVAAGSIPLPGRLNDLLHIIYKNYQIPLRRSRLSVACMTKDTLLKENIDGEAVLFAARRLRQQPVDKRLLLVISDGAPADDSTLSTNAPLLLDQHLRAVIKHLQAKTTIVPAAIGIGHDVKRYYKNALKINDPDALAQHVLQPLAQLWAG